MFGSNEKNVGKKSFQKPNILRRKAKVSFPKANINNVNESPEVIPLVTTSHVETNISDQIQKITKRERSNKLTNVSGTVWGLALEDCDDKQNNLLIAQETDIHANLNTTSIISEIKSGGKSLEQNSLNIESFINSAGSIAQVQPLCYDVTVSTEKKTTEDKPKWCFDISNNSMDFSSLNNFKDHQLGDLEDKLDSVIVVPSQPISKQQPEQVHNQAAATTTTTSIAANYSNRAVKFKCDEPDCNKGFWSEEKLKKHKNSHKRQAYRTPTQITYECPVKKKSPDGTEEKCPRTFEVRSDLLKHLDEDHTLDEAAHRCSVCGRRFFWAMGLRAHGSSLCARGGLTCAWPGCGRVFRLPCRLREHARAHTGDRPYMCRYPDCGWAFRSASKLVRHARRHTDERRHACATCGRAFLRREHLRDHAARHHAPAKRTAHHCTHAGCEQSFTNMSSLYMHMKKVHREAKEVAVAPAAEEAPATVSEDRDFVYLVSVPDDVVVEEEDSKEASLVNVELEGEQSQGAESAGSAGSAAGAEWHAARTHCTWPLSRAHYVLDDDVHVGRAEGSVSDVFTVRSDLFLHGNVPIDDDSQQIVGAALSGEASAMDADLCLIDAHPTIDLMQEELMYEDAADESSFRVFLMNGGDLT